MNLLLVVYRVRFTPVLCAFHGENDQGGGGVFFTAVCMCIRVCVCVCVCVCVRHSPGRHQQCFAVGAEWGPLYCRLNSASAMAPSAALDDLDCC